ncbi:MAG: hypothetical protein HQL63_09480 [Magnetococcales bacterium]|nr:hypothetical protein [Magnetococcales bacterium]MBF0321368.1 hypothetical protein [Magnetococcales bacterium]
MSITSKDLLRLAQRLAGSHLEVDLRDAGNRAYFAAFHASLQLSVALGLLAPQVREQEGHHKRLIRAMQTAKVPGVDQADFAVRRLGQALRSLRDQRNVSEYRLDKSFVRSQAKQMIITGERILNEVERILWEYRGRDVAEGGAMDSLWLEQEPDDPSPGDAVQPQGETGPLPPAPPEASDVEQAPVGAASPVPLPDAITPPPASAHAEAPFSPAPHTDDEKNGQGDNQGKPECGQ